MVGSRRLRTHRSNSEPIRLRTAHNTIRLYIWGDNDCCLPRGATSATLIDGQPPQAEPDEPPDTPDTTQQKRKPPKAPPPTEPIRALDLRPGDLLLFEEVLGPRTDLAAITPKPKPAPVQSASAGGSPSKGGGRNCRVQYRQQCSHVYQGTSPGPFGYARFNYNCLPVPYTPPGC